MSSVSPEQDPDHSRDGADRYKVIGLDGEPSQDSECSHSKYRGEHVERLVLRKQYPQAEKDRQITDDTDHRGGDAGQRRLQATIAAKPFDVRRTEKNEQKRG